MCLQERDLKQKIKQLHPQGKCQYFYLFFSIFNGKISHFIFNRFNAVHIPKTDDTLNATSRRYGTRTEPQTHPNNHSHYKPSETTFRSSFINPKKHPSSVYRSRDPD